MWLIDPVDEPEAMERVAALGEPAGVLQLFVAHNRDGEAIAKRLGVPFHKLPDVLPDSPFSVLNARPAGSGRSARCGGRSRAG